MPPLPPQIALARRAAKIARAGQLVVTHWKSLPQEEREHAKEQIARIGSLTRQLVRSLREIVGQRRGTIAGGARGRDVARLMNELRVELQALRSIAPEIGQVARPRSRSARIAGKALSSASGLAAKRLRARGGGRGGPPTDPGGGDLAELDADLRSIEDGLAADPVGPAADPLVTTVFRTDNPLQADKRIYLVDNPLQADDHIRWSTDRLAAASTVYVTDSPLDADETAFIVAPAAC